MEICKFTITANGSKLKNKSPRNVCSNGFLESGARVACKIMRKTKDVKVVEYWSEACKSPVGFWLDNIKC